MGDVRVAPEGDEAGGVRARRATSRGGHDHTRHLPVADVVLYSARGCHLCERARETLVAELGEGGFEEVDITGDEELETRHREWLPVVEIGGERAFVHHVDPDALRRKLTQSRA